MTTKTISSGTVHKTPDDMRTALIAATDMYAAWEDLTPLARNEWICWVTSAKKEDTRAKRIGRMCEDLSAGKRRPCCWPGCPHRNKTSRT